MLMAQLPYYVLALAALITSFAAGLGAATGARPRWFWLQSAGLGLVFVALSLIVIASGPAPQWSGPELRLAIRVLLLAGGLLWCTWGSLYLPHIVRVRPHGEEQK